MRNLTSRNFAPARLVGLAFAVSFVAALATAPPARAASDDHAQAVAALNDLKAALAELTRADASYATDRNVYHRASQRAINALAGVKGEGYAPGPGNPGDAAGALGHIDALLDRKDTPVWADPLHGAEANILAAVAHLLDARKARELMDYELAASRAITYMEVARGRPNETGVFGGLEGALADTVLGVPADAPLEDACAKPKAAPAYGVHGGYLAWVATPATEGVHALAESPGASEMDVQGGIIVMRTVAAAPVDAICAREAKAAAKPAEPAHPALSPSPQPTHAALTAPAGGPPPALYTHAQAVAGAQVYATKCVACHGANLQGVAAPSVAGNDFLITAQHDGWTLAIIRYIVFNLMPRNSPASLPPAEAADVMAYLLASSCYPAGNTPFPSADAPALALVKLGPLPGRPAGQNEKGVCPVK
jgi:mono/diheme cytochrome c family protein